ncbi:pyridoxamine 5'-phosphate oxidase family protein [Gammaproteobacteria bacterium]|mgnify:FL=1|nr:pyridoxamine 5'-phosphate oxidase family protein [Gammaproteobacteria bacterium]MDC0421119.1 pyridoxamine 5'-phosphate oxidase family protein [Gammaproteobacteria bacterium]
MSIQNSLEAELPDEYNEISQTLESANLILTNAVENAKTLFHTLAVSSIDNNQIATRVMVLREFNLKERYIRFHTDYRAAKIDHYSENNSASVLGYDPNLKIQIKLQGSISVHYNDQVTQAAWEGSTTRSKKCYSVKGGSTLEISDPKEYDLKDGNIEDGYINFAVLKFSFNNLEFLHLKSSGHRRALHSWNESFASTWLVP